MRDARNVKASNVGVNRHKRGCTMREDITRLAVTTDEGQDGKFMKWHKRW